VGDGRGHAHIPMAVEGSKRRGHGCIVAAPAPERRVDAVTQKRRSAATGRAGGSSSSVFGALSAATCAGGVVLVVVGRRCAVGVRVGVRIRIAHAGVQGMVRVLGLLGVIRLVSRVQRRRRRFGLQRTIGRLRRIRVALIDTLGLVARSGVGI
jgi:hypothetical protein